MNQHYSRVRAYSPYFDSRTRWYNRGWMYKDAYAIYVKSGDSTYALKTSTGAPMFIPWGSPGAYTQWAADITNPEFRQQWIAQASVGLKNAYQGLFVDDMNLELKVVDSAGSYVMPRGKAGDITKDVWQEHMAIFMEEIRAAFPDIEIVHNAIWSTPPNATTNRALAAADYVEIEHGVNDGGIVGGSGKYGFETLLAYIDKRHADGQGVIIDGQPATEESRQYQLAFYLLISTGMDFIGSEQAGSKPDDWWPGYNLQFGRPTTKRYLWKGVLRRSFGQGYVLVNPPGYSPKTLTITSGMDISGKPLSTITLPERSGIVIRKQ